MQTFTQADPPNSTASAISSKRCKGGKAMNVEQLDGFFAALIAGPVMPSEYYPEVFGGEISEVCEFGGFLLCHEHDEDTEMRPKPNV
jgi:Uncharacterised protein family (UPF0149)